MEMEASVDGLLSLYKVDLKRVQQAGTDVSEDCDKEDVKTACW